MALNQKAIKVLGKVFEAGFTDFRYDNGRYSCNTGHYHSRHRHYQ